MSTVKGFFLLVPIIFMVLVWLGFSLLPNPTFRHYLRVRQGMSRMDVNREFGEPPNELRVVTKLFQHVHDEWGSSKEGLALVFFDENGIVVRKQWIGTAWKLQTPGKW